MIFLSKPTAFYFDLDLRPFNLRSHIDILLQLQARIVKEPNANFILGDYITYGLDLGRHDL